jgi:hypothetical protein
MISCTCIYTNMYLVYIIRNLNSSRLAWIQSYVTMKLSACAYWLGQKLTSNCRLVCMYQHALWRERGRERDTEVTYIMCGLELELFRVNTGIRFCNGSKDDVGTGCTDITQHSSQVPVDIRHSFSHCCAFL